MKTPSLFLIIFIAFTGFSFSQSDSGYVCLVYKKDFKELDSLKYYFQPHGLILKQNAIYNFKINGNKYYNYRILNIRKDSISIAFTTDSISEITFSLNEIDRLFFESRNNNMVGRGHKFKSSKYNFKIVKDVDYLVPGKKVCENKDCSKWYNAQLYMTAGFGWKPIYYENGKYYLLDNKYITEIIDRR